MNSTLSNNDLNQTLRIATGSALGFFISKSLNWPFGIFYTVYPMLLLGLAPVFTPHIIRQFILGSLLPTLFVLTTYSYFSHLPMLCALLVFMAFVFLFTLMSKGALFFFGAFSVVGLSIQLHMASYGASGNSLYTIGIANVRASLLSLLIASAMFTLFKDTEARQPPPKVDKSASSVRHEALLCSIVATLSFVFFQVFDLQESISAQVATILVLFPMCWKGATVSGLQRAIGTLIGCNLALFLQLILWGNSNVLFFATLSLWFLTFIMSRNHALGGGGAGAAFGALTTFGILYGQNLTPQQDLVYSSLYRFASVMVAILITLSVVYVVHKFLNTFTATRHHTFLT